MNVYYYQGYRVESMKPLGVRDLRDTGGLTDCVRVWLTGSRVSLVVPVSSVDEVTA